MSLLDDFSNIPGYAEAVNREQANRELAFLSSPAPICGVPIRHMNARHHILLVGCRNGFICGGRPSPEDVAMFLWFLSPQYSTQPGEREAFIAEHVKNLDFFAVVKGILAYLETVYQDWPQAEGGNSKHYTAPVASLIDFLAFEYGWSDEAILEMPLARMFQYIRRIEMRHNPKAIMFNKTDRFMSEYLKQRMASANGQGAN